MTNTSTKGGFFAKALAAACSVALVASLTPAAAVSAFAADREVTINVYYESDTSMASAASTATVAFEKLAVTPSALSGVQNAVYYDSSATQAWGVYTAGSYVTIDDIMANSDVSSYWNDEASKVVISNGTDEYETTYAALNAPQYFYPNTTKTAQSTADAVQVKPGIALKSVNSVIGNPAENKTATEQAKTNWGNVNTDGYTDTKNYVFYHGLTANEYANVYNTWASTFVEGVTTINVVVPDPDDAQRVAGNIWADTMTEAFDQTAAKLGKGAGSMTEFVLTTADSYQDTLAASPLAGAFDTPILMTEGGQLTEQTKKLIEKYADFSALGSGDVTFYVIGGPNAISEDVLNQIRSITKFVGQSGLKFERIAGETAWDTSVAVRDKVVAEGGSADNVIIATQNGFQDALSIAPYAYDSKTSIVLTNLENELADETVDALLGDSATNQVTVGSAKVTILGGPNAVSYSVDNQLNAVTLGGGKLNRIAGNDCWETSNKIADAIVNDAASTINDKTNWAPSATVVTVGVATSDDYYDALSGAALCGTLKAPMLLVSNSNTYTIDNFLAKNNEAAKGTGKGYTMAKVFGGVNVISNAVLNDVETVLNEK